jgi:peptidoglycan-associated lipoprotein
VKAILGQTKGVQVRVEGHADQRGTVEYNLALGQRRANSMKSYYATLGVQKSLLSTISYGEEHPVCTEDNESCWSKNRRGETTLKSPTAIRIPMDKLPAQ